MKIQHHVSRLLLAGTATGLACAVVVLLAGCEAEPVQDFGISLEPRTVRLKQNQSQEFIASGGARYTWALASTNASTWESSGTNGVGPWGFLDTTYGDRVVYTSLRSPSRGQVLIQLTVTGSLGLAGPSNDVPTSTTAAYIYHIP